MKKILINDYAGHPFQFDLSRELALRGYKVWHCYSADIEGAKASFDDENLESLTIFPISIGHKVRKYQFHKRLLDERCYGYEIVKKIKLLEPDITINANMPLDAFKIIRKAEINIGSQKVYWLQDMIGHAVYRLFHRKWYSAGSIIGARFLRLESKLLKTSDHIVAISDGFEPYILEHGAKNEDISYIHNWAPIKDLPMLDHNNKWRTQYFKNSNFLFLYSGTLGLKHNPEALLTLAKELSTREINAEVVVVSEGLGANWLSRKKQTESIEKLQILPYQPFDRLPEVLASGDVLLTLLEKDAGIFSVPSKILSYMCAGRPQLAAMPSSNLGATLISSTECGLIVEPGNNTSFVQCALDMYASSNTDRKLLGDRAREFAEVNFDISKITDRFETEIFRN